MKSILCIGDRAENELRVKLKEYCQEFTLHCQKSVNGEILQIHHDEPFDIAILHTEQWTAITDDSACSIREDICSHIPTVIFGATMSSQDRIAAWNAGISDIISNSAPGQEVYARLVNLARRHKKTKTHTEELATDREQLELLYQHNRVVAMGEMLSAVAHHWRQPLSVISLMVESLRMDHDDGVISSEAIAHYTHEITSELKRLSQTIDTFRNILKPDSYAEPFDLEDAIKGVLIFMWPQLKELGIRTVLDDSTSGIHLHGYQRDFQQVLLAIIANSRDSIVANKVRGIITITIEHDSDDAILGIADNGGGMDPHLLPRIFDPYFTTKHRQDVRETGGGGAGTDLYIAKIVIERKMGGKITMENGDDGCLTTIKLPLRGKQVREE
ncbi:sensor histidine kinase [Desulfurispira natronophila]|uniref:histidine kinase n=1 Tax=Desulfurispira natronophila TaxID=682562 RepID=A0A7W7Y2A1_9BACT|nr:ATP-binding protein [Desulfurispira natronophila]MBB5020780.1 signal transduction histidine kinase [Desulfurispira natronophila]